MRIVVKRESLAHSLPCKTAPGIHRPAERVRRLTIDDARDEGPPRSCAGQAPRSRLDRQHAVECVHTWGTVDCFSALAGR